MEKVTSQELRKEFVVAISFHIIFIEDRLDSLKASIGDPFHVRGGYRTLMQIQ
jgi:hypothetical protein